MSTSQEQLISSLKKIKEVEERVEKEIKNHRKDVDNKISQLDADLKKAIADAKAEGEKLVDSSIDEARNKATAETEKVIQDAKVPLLNQNVYVLSKEFLEELLITL